MKRILFFLIFLQAVAFGFAQNKTRIVRVYSVNIDTLKNAQTRYGSILNYEYSKFKDAVERSAAQLEEKDVYVFAFESKQQRSSFISKYLESKAWDEKQADMTKYYRVKANNTEIIYNWEDVTNLGSGFVSFKKLRNGEVEIDAPDDAVFLVGTNYLYGVDEVWMHFDLGESGKGLANGRELDIYLPFVQSKEFVKNEIPDIPDPVQVSYDTPWEIHWTWKYPIKAEDANPDIRLGFRPIAKEYESGGVFKLIEPKVVDGANFRVYQRQRMGQDIQKNDPMGAWADTMLIYADKADTIRMEDVIAKKVPGKHYTIDMELYEMSHDGIYSTQRFQVYDGRSRMPLKYLDFRFKSVEFQHKIFEKKGKAEKNSETKNSRLPFERGKATLNPADMEGQRLLQEAIDFARSIATGEEIYEQTFEIEGFASPEGGYSTNMTLAKKRAEFLRDEILKRVPGQRIVVKDPVTVQPWTVVADSIEQLGSDYAQEAQQVREICESLPNDMAAQERKIKTLPFYTELIEAQILPKLRLSRILTEYTLYRVLSSNEVIERYQSDPASYLSTTSKRLPYEYYHLMNYYKDDLETLEPLARVAYARFNDANDYISSGTMWADRPWTLAAYHLARCQINRVEYEEAMNTLKPYVLVSPARADWNLAFNSTIPQGGFTRGPMNEPSIVLLYIESLCGTGEYLEAYKVFANSLNTQKYKIVGQFIEMMMNPTRLFTDEVLRRDMAATSVWNSMVVNAALCQEETNPVRRTCVDKAISILSSDTTIFKDDDPRVHYMKARLKFDKLCQGKPQKNQPPRSNTPEYYAAEFSQDEISDRSTMAAELMKTFMLDENFLYDELRWDGYFPMGVYLKAKEVWEKNDPTKLKLDRTDAEFQKKYAKPHKPKTEAPKEK